MKILLPVWMTLLTVSLNCNAQQVQQPTAAQVLQEHIRQENTRTQAWSDRQTEVRGVKRRRR